MLFILVHFSKADLPISVRLPGNCTLSIVFLPLNTSLAIFVTVSGITISVAEPVYCFRTPSSMTKSFSPAASSTCPLSSSGCRAASSLSAVSGSTFASSCKASDGSSSKISGSSSSEISDVTSSGISDGSSSNGSSVLFVSFTYISSGSSDEEAAITAVPLFPANTEIHKRPAKNFFRCFFFILSLLLILLLQNLYGFLIHLSMEKFIQHLLEHFFLRTGQGK